MIDPEELVTTTKVKTGFWLFVLSILLTAVFGVVALPFLLAMNAAPGDQISETLNSSILSIIISFVLLGPLIEEIIFRGWLSGTWCSIVASGLSLVAVYGGSALLTQLLGETALIKQVIVLIAAIALLWALSPLDAGRRIPGFEKIFPLVFWTQGIAFGALHFQNLAASSLVISFISTVPLIACGLIWGYARIKLGLRWAIILHTCYNVPAAFGSIFLLRFYG